MRPASARVTVAEGDELTWVGVSSGHDDIVLATAEGRIARFNESEVRAMGRDAAGVIGIRLSRKGDQVMGMGVVQPGNDILVLTETGYGKRVALTEFRKMHRGSQGVRLISLEGAKTGRVAAVELVDESDEGCCSFPPAARSCAPTSRASTATVPAPVASSSCA